MRYLGYLADVLTTREATPVSDQEEVSAPGLRATTLRAPSCLCYHRRPPVTLHAPSCLRSHRQHRQYPHGHGSRPLERSAR